MSESRMDPAVLEVVLRKCAREITIQKILEVEAIPAVPKGENYTSDVFRLVLKVVLGNGRLASKSVIMKQLHTKEKSGELLKTLNIAKTEADVYSIILKEMGNLMQEFEDTDETIWCDLIYFDQHASLLLLEDLKTSGYKSVSRQLGQDLDHALLALRGLARYHGMAKVLEERGVVSKDNNNEFYMLSSPQFVKMFLYQGLRNAAKAIRDGWGAEWEEVATKILSIEFTTFVNKMMPLSKPLENEFTVLNQGDCWTNNMMFKYDWRNRPVAVKLIDHQGPHYNTPCIDITYFMYTSIQPQVRRQHYATLLESYHQCLIRTLERFGYGGTKPTLENINSTMERLSIFGRCLFVYGHPIRVSENIETFDLDKVMETEGEAGYNNEILKEPRMKEEMGPDVKIFVQKNLPSLLEVC